MFRRSPRRRTISRKRRRLDARVRPRGPLAQLVEQGTLNPKVAGSNPARPTSLPRPDVSPRQNILAPLAARSSTSSHRHNVLSGLARPAIRKRREGHLGRSRYLQHPEIPADQGSSRLMCSECGRRSRPGAHAITTTGPLRGILGTSGGTKIARARFLADGEPARAPLPALSLGSKSKGRSP